MAFGIESDTFSWLTEFPHFYEASWPLVDALVYTLIFVGLSRVVFEKHFEGQGGKALILGVGISLTVGMVWAEIEYGFSLKNLGSFAMVLVALLLVVLIYHVGRAVGLSKIASGSLVLFAGLPLATQILPGFARLVSGILPLVLIFWLASGVLTGTNAWHSDKGRWWGQSLDQPPLSDWTKGEEKQTEKLDVQEKKDARKAYRHSKHIIRILRRMRSELPDLGGTEEGRKKLQQELGRIAREEHELVKDLADLHQLVHRVWRKGESVYRRVRVSVRQAKGKQRRKGKDAEEDIKKELTLQQALETLGARFRQFDAAFRQAVSRAVFAIGRNRTDDAVRWIDHALHWELRAQRILGEVRHVQHKAHKTLKDIHHDLEAAA